MAPKGKQKKLERVIFVGLGSCESLPKQIVRRKRRKRRKKTPQCKLNVCKQCVTNMLKNDQLKGNSAIMKVQETLLPTPEQKIESAAPSSPACIDLSHSDDEETKKYQFVPETSVNGQDDGITILSSSCRKNIQMNSQENGITVLSSTCIRNKQIVPVTSVNGQDDGITVLSPSCIKNTQINNQEDGITVLSSSCIKNTQINGQEDGIIVLSSSCIKNTQIVPETSVNGQEDGIIVLSSSCIKNTQINGQEDGITVLSSSCIKNTQIVPETSVNGQDDGITVLSSTMSNRLDDSVIFVEEVNPKAKPFSKPCTLVGTSIGKRGAQNKRKRDEEKENPRKRRNANASESPTLNVEELLGPLIRPMPTSQNLRPIVIDGSNVARSHGQKTGTFSCRGIALCISYFQGRGHTQVTAMVPQFRRNFYQGPDKITDQWMLETLSRSQLVVFTPSRPLNGKIVASYDDRFIVDLACQNGGVIISNDFFRDVAKERQDWRTTIEQRLLMYCFVGDVFMVPQDPCGRHGPKLLQFLSFPKG